MAKQSQKLRSPVSMHSFSLQGGLHPSQGGLLQRTCACGGAPGLTGECAECRAQRLGSPQLRSSNRAEPFVVPSVVHDVLRSPGQPLDLETRSFMEPQFGHDFSKVRVHTDSQAALATRAVNALAFTVGRDIVFDSARVEPRSATGTFLLAHELVHTLQQGLADNTDSRDIDELQTTATSDRSETEADTIATQVLSVRPAVGTTAKIDPPTLFRAKPVLARYDCSRLAYRQCTTGVYKCGYGGSGTCGWVGPSRGGCICVGAARPPVQRVLEVLAILGLSITLLATIIAALIDPEPATKLALAGLSGAQINLLLMLLGFEGPSESGPTATTASTNQGESALMATASATQGKQAV